MQVLQGIADAYLFVAGAYLPRLSACHSPHLLTRPLARPLSSTIIYQTYPVPPMCHHNYACQWFEYSGYSGRVFMNTLNTQTEHFGVFSGVFRRGLV